MKDTDTHPSQTAPQTAPAEGLANRLESLRNFVANVDGPIYQREQNVRTVNEAIDALRSLAPQASPPYTPEYLLHAAENTLIPTDFRKKSALFELCDALSKPDGYVKPPQVQMENAGVSAQASDGQGASAAPTGGQSETTRATQSEAHPTPPQGSGETPSFCDRVLALNAEAMGGQSEWDEHGHAMMNLAREADAIADELAALTASAQSAAGAEAESEREIFRRFQAWSITLSKAEATIFWDDVEWLRNLSRHAPPAVEWISVEERLPEKNGMYLALREGDALSELCAHIFDKGHWLFGDGSDMDERITHWMPIPPLSASPRAKEGA